MVSIPEPRRYPQRMFSSHLRVACAAVFVLAAAPLFSLRAVEDEVTAKERAAVGEAAVTKGSQMLYGPVLTYGIDAAGPKESRHVASKGLVIRPPTRGWMRRPRHPRRSSRRCATSR